MVRRAGDPQKKLSDMVEKMMCSEQKVDDSEK